MPFILGFMGPEQLPECLKGCDVVVIPAGVPRKPGKFSLLEGPRAALKWISAVLLLKQLCLLGCTWSVNAPAQSSLWYQAAHSASLHCPLWNGLNWFLEFLLGAELQRLFMQVLLNPPLVFLVPEQRSRNKSCFFVSFLSRTEIIHFVLHQLYSNFLGHLWVNAVKSSQNVSALLHFHSVF